MLSPSRRELLAGAGAAALSGCATPPRPNVLIILPDQLRAGALAHAGDPNAHSPALDALAAQSARLTASYCADPHCSPARAALWTSRYPSETGVVTTGVRLPEELPCLSHSLTTVGYRCGYIGKWHLNGGNGIEGYVPPGPLRRGFDAYWAAHEDNGHAYTSATYWADDPIPRHPSPPDRYEPYFQTDLAAQFLTAERAGPWCLVVAYGPPHPPEPLETALGEWEGYIPDELLWSFDADRLTLSPNVPDTRLGISRQFLRGYYAAILSIDRCVGRLLAALEASGQADDTVVIVTSDHGELAGSHGVFGKERPLQEAVTVPFLLRYPGVVPPRVHDAPVSGVDLLPTVLGLTGAPALGPHHGRDLAPWLRGEAAAPSDPVYVQGSLDDDEASPWEMIRLDRWAYSATEGGAETLHDVVADPYQLDERLEDPDAAEALVRCREALESWHDAT